MSRSSRSAERRAVAILFALLGLACTCSGAGPRREVVLADGWRTALATAVDPSADCTAPAFDDSAWRAVAIPHNWDAYEGARQTRHGNLHGSAWYRRRFEVAAADLAENRRVFLHFEGVGSYATVWVNGREVGRHAGGLTTFTLDVTGAVRAGVSNTLVVRADHPAGIRDLPWVCGGCELVYGFSEGPQPFGIFRPVSMIATADVRVEPFGVHIWADPGADSSGATLHVRTELRNHGPAVRTFTLATRLRDGDGAPVIDSYQEVTLAPGETRTIERYPLVVLRARLWSPAQPHLYTAASELLDGDTLLDRETTPFGIRTVAWPDPEGPPDQPLLINGQPVFLNGTCDYEHNLGANHAFTDEQVAARAAQIRAAGFNAFRDAHHPHNLRFNAAWDRSGTLWWTQFGAQIWFDRDDFRANYKRLLREWVKERRNSPSLILWGLQNESKLPTAFAAECAAIIREMDPTASTQRLVTTCNGGTGTDWNVPQNWTGTYGGDPLTYADDLRRQRLVGEYGAWRSLGLHAEPDGGVAVSPDDPSGFAAFARGPLSEERLNALLETKIRLADTVRERSVGHFHWPFTTHANPGRIFGENGEQLFDGIRVLDRVGPANNKGLLTLWGEPTDAFHLYRANFTDARTHPMVAILSHTWPDRWAAPGRRSGIVVHSNCDEVELFNDLGDRSLGVRTRAGPGTHFRWDDVPIEFNLLRAEGRVGIRTVATDAILLRHLPAPPRYAAHDAAEPDPLAPVGGHTYVHRLNCGGPDYRDRGGNLWRADRDASTSWAAAYPHLPAEFASQRRFHAPVAGTRDDALFQTFRYGREQLRYTFAVAPGTYEVDLFFAEPWYLPGGGADCGGWRLFDVAVNGVTQLRDLDIWRESGGHAHALRRSLRVAVDGNTLEISFPRVAAGQAVISAIAIRTTGTVPPDRPAAPRGDSDGLERQSHLDLGDRVYRDAGVTLTSLPLELLEAELIRPAADPARTLSAARPQHFRVEPGSDVYIAHDARIALKPAWLKDWAATGLVARTSGNPDPGFDLFRRHFATGGTVQLGPNSLLGAYDPASVMYFAIVQRVRPLPPAQWIINYSGAEGIPTGHCRTGLPVRAGGDTRFVMLPGVLGDADWIRPAPVIDPAAAPSFDLTAHAEVYVAFDERLKPLPAWTRDWIATNQAIVTSDSAAPRQPLVRRRYGPGDTVRLGANGVLADGPAAVPYVVFVRPVRPSATFSRQASDATSATWLLSVAVGDRYGLNIRHRTTAVEATRATYSIVAESDGAVVCTGAIEFPSSTADGAWQVARTRSCASLNAGRYLLRVDLPAGTPAVEFDSLEVE